MIDEKSIRERLEIAATKSFGRPMCKKDVELAERVAKLYADLPPAYGKLSVVKILHGSAKTMKNRPEYGWSKSNGYKLKELDEWNGIVDTVRNLLRENIDEKEVAYVNAFDEMAGEELIENAIRRKFNMSEKGQAFASNAEEKKGFSTAYSVLTDVFSKIAASTPEEMIAKPKKIRPAVALSRILTLDYVKDTLRELREAQEKGLLRVSIWGGPIHGMNVVPELIDFNGKVKEFIHNLSQNSKKVDKHDTEYYFMMGIAVEKEPRHFYQLVHVLTIRDDITPVSVRREYWLQMGYSNIIDHPYDIPFSENDLEKPENPTVNKNPFKEKWLR